MRIVIAGAPGSGKAELAQFFSEQDGVIVQKDPAATMLNHNFYGVGQLADYRTEAFIATARAHQRDAKDLINVYTHSIADSLAYSTVRLANMIKYDSVDQETQDQWWIVNYLVSMMLRDTWHADHVLFLPGHEDEAGIFLGHLEVNLEEVLKQIRISYTKIDVDGASVFEQAAKLLL